MSVKERQSRERGARRNSILAAAARVFARHGLEGATIEMVAHEAEVAVGTIYLYFASRDDLFLSLVAEHANVLRARYLEIFARRLDPRAELRAIAQAYLDYLNEARELFLSQHSAGFTRLRKRLRRAAEVRDFQRVMELGQEIFGLWERTIRRAFEAGAIANSMGPRKTAAVIWATLNGAFMLMGDGGFFRGVTGLDPADFADEALDAHLAPQPNGARNGHSRRVKNARETNPERAAAPASA
ncbi:MAG: TetR/AcrR family transcriptional regulator [Candidatus Binataceae bacterium]